MARLSDEEIDERLSGLDGWEREGDAICCSFHSEGGLTENDFELTRRIDALA
jgi:pterin-4a-carbinolamine dehydratase